MGDHAAQQGVRIGVENGGGPEDDYLRLIASVAHPWVGATLDLGHCAYFESVLALTDPSARVARLNALLRVAVRTLGARLFSLHVHDVRPGDWRDHRCVGSGVIDFPALFEELRAVSYAGLFEIELEEPEREAAAATTGARLTALCQTWLADAPPAQAAGQGTGGVS